MSGLSVLLAVLGMDAHMVVSAVRAEAEGQFMCSINGPDSSGLSWTFGLESQSKCKATCRGARFEPEKIEDAYASYFTATCVDKDNVDQKECHKGDTCYCRDNDLKDMLPPHNLWNSCSNKNCWEYYLDVMSKVEKTLTTNFWTPNLDCPACGEAEQPACDNVNIANSLGMDELMKLKTGSEEDQERFNVIVAALKKNGIKVDARRAAWTTEVAGDLDADRYTGAGAGGEGGVRGMPDVSEEAWGACSHECIKSGDAEPTQTRDVKCVVETDGKLNFEDDALCKQLIPKIEKPQVERSCGQQLQSCFQWQCLDHKGAAVDKQNCAGLST